MVLILILIAVIAFIVVATSKFHLHPFLTLLLAAFITAFAYGIPIDKINSVIANGFGGILGYIGIVIVLGTIIGIILEKSGAAITMAESIIKILGRRFPALTISIIGYLVSIPVFCDSGFVILNSLKNSLAKKMKYSSVSMSVALATGLYATHTFVPPTPGPIAAAGNLGLGNNLGIVIMFGLVVAAVTAFAGMIWATHVSYLSENTSDIDEIKNNENKQDGLNLQEISYKSLPSPFFVFAPIFIPIVLISIGSIAHLPSRPFGNMKIFEALSFLGQPITALLIGLFIALFLIKGDKKIKKFSECITKGLYAAAPIVLITGAGGAFGAVLKASPIGAYLGEILSGLGIGIFAPFIIAAALKTAQGSSTVAIVTASALVAPLLGDLGLSSEVGRALAIMSIGAGAMTVSHANDSFFWVVSQFSKMDVKTAYKAFTTATLIQGITGIITVYLLTLVFL